MRKFQELLPGQCLSEYLGKNEKTKVIIKVASKQSGQPAREPLLSEQDQKMLMMHSARRREEIQKLTENNDDSYHDSAWADQKGLKRRVMGMNEISWKPF